MSTNGFEVIHDTNYYTAGRLPVDLLPRNYNLTLSPNLQDFTFNGTVVIQFVETKSAVSEIILNASELEIKSGYVQDTHETRINLKKIIYNSHNETIVLKFDQDNLKPSSLTLTFNGLLNDRMKGFYRSSFKIDGQTIYAAATQFEATEARRAFPCFDEPVHKATFDITLIYNDDSISFDGKSYKHIALSNGNLLSESKDQDGKTIAKFETSLKMSTYLVAFVVGPFEFIESQSSKGCKVRVYSTPGKKEQGRFALDRACKSLDYYEDYFGIRYPLNKMDLIAVPDFNMGAMENWGLITYREACLLFDPAKTSSSAKQYIATVVAHEISHMWFGNLVTMEWWSDLWLKEGFASFMQYYCPDHYFPEWDLWSQFVSDTWSPAMLKDSLHNSHPIQVPLNFASEVDQIFDDISYKKGSSIIRMLHNFVGDEMFRKGIKDYLNRFSYKNATTNDLWDCLGSASNKPITQMMSAWTCQIGYPWIKVELIKQDESGDVTITLEQQRFTADGKLTETDETLRWLVPISIISGCPDVKPISILLDEKKKSIVIPNQGNHWFKLNHNSIGFYRVAYPKNILDKLIDAISRDELSAMDRLGIQNDCFALCRAGHLEIGDLLRLVAIFEDETNLTVWKSIDYCMTWLSVIFRESPYSDHFLEYGRRLYQKIYRKLSSHGYGIESHNDSMLLSIVMTRLILLRDCDVIDDAKKLFQQQTDENKPIPADIRAAVYMAISISGNDMQFDYLFHMRSIEESHEERNRIVAALTYATIQDRLKRAMELIMSDDVRSQDKVSALMGLGFSQPQLAWKLFKDNHQEFRKVYKGLRLSHLIESTTRFLIESRDALDVESFFKQNQFPDADRAICQSLETIRLNSNWLGTFCWEIDGYGRKTGN